MEVFDRALATIKERQLCSSETPALLMVSGGGDSTALAYLAKGLQDRGLLGYLEIFHMNHRLRGADADADERFAEGLAELLGLPFRSLAVDIPALSAEGGENVEALARRLRYRAAQEALSEICQQQLAPTSAGRIIVAHNADDRIENFAMRAIVGTGPGGFRSMKYRNRRVVRPLLDLSRNDLRAYIEDRAQQGLPVMRTESRDLWCEDATNAHTDRFRAYVRHEVIPLMEQRNPQLRETLTRTMNLIGDEDDMLQEMTESLVSRSVEWLEPDGGACIILPDLAEEPQPLLRRVVVEVLHRLLGFDARIENATVDAVLGGFADGAPNSGYVANIQGNLAVSSNKQGIRIEPMEVFRIRRKRV